ncbi:Ubiquitin-activating enzyme E1-like, partial [Dictyocoela roeselum]
KSDNKKGKHNTNPCKKTVYQSTPFKRSTHDSETDDEILIIGAGGIGCELIKILIFVSKNITIIDYDTIELTNLNRQFIFTQKDINKRKSEIIGKTYQIRHLEKSIYDLDINFYKKFKIVFGCLDNANARSFVNKMCRFLKIPFIDGGSSGYLGQAMLFIDGYECYDCTPALEEEIPVCTVHGVPKNYENIVYWAKTIFIEHLNENRSAKFEELIRFIEFDPTSIKFDPTSIKFDSTSIKFDSISIDMSSSGTNNDLKRQVNLKNDKNKDKLEEVEKKENFVEIKPFNELIRFEKENDLKKSTIQKGAGEKRGEFKENLFISLNEIRDRERVEFSRHDKSILKIIYYASVLRAKAFGIEHKNFMETEKILTKIIPSICTTNSMVASLMAVIYENLKKSPFMGESKLGAANAIENNSDHISHKLSKMNSTSMPACADTLPDLGCLFSNLKAYGFEIEAIERKRHTKHNNFFISMRNIINCFETGQSKKGCLICNSIKLICEVPETRIGIIVEYFGCDSIYQDDVLIYGQGYEDKIDQILNFNEFYFLQGHFKILLYLVESQERKIFY